MLCVDRNHPYERRRRYVAIGRRVLIAVACTVTMCIAGVTGAGASSQGGVLAGNTAPRGWSLTRITAAAAAFDVSNNTPSDYPSTPFQLLYYAPSTLTVTSMNGGVAFSGSNSFRVAAGTPFFVPMFSVDDSPPVIGTFPTSHAQAVTYFFDPSQIGGQGFEITVDGKTTQLGSSFLAGPVTTSPLPDGGGTHMITLGAFLSPLARGTHTVSINGGIFGALLPTYVGIAFDRETFTYSVDVSP